MNTLSVDRSEARDKAREYRDASRRQPNNAEYRAAAEVYALLAAGHTLVDVGIAIREAGLDATQRPRLAIARADRKQVYLSWQKYDQHVTFDARSARARGSLGDVYAHLVERFNLNRTPHLAENRYRIEGFALVPMAPPAVLDEARAKEPGGLKDWHVLWEVERWSDKPLLAEPPVDPYLLRRVRGDLFVVLAQWDLTEVERLVMAGRARVEN